MRRQIFQALCAATLALGLWACADDIGVRPTNAPKTEGEGNVNITLRLPPDMLAVTRANDYWQYNANNTNSAMGGLTNCELGDIYALRYQLEVWDKTGTERIIDRQVTVDHYSDVISYNLNLYPGHDYRVVAWADFIAKKASHDDYDLAEPWNDDLFYDTRDLKNVTAKHFDIENNAPTDGSRFLNLEGRDAYWNVIDMHVGNTTVLREMVLRRPFAKLRVVTTDWNKLGLPVPTRLEMSYKNCRRFHSINLLDGSTKGEDIASGDSLTFTTTLEGTNRYKKGYDNVSVANRTILVDYLITETDRDQNVSPQTRVHFRLKAFRPVGSGADPVSTSQAEVVDGYYLLTNRYFDLDIPIQRNYLTTLLGDVLTTGLNLRVLCYEGFYDFYNPPYGTMDYTDDENYPAQRPSFHEVELGNDEAKYWVITSPQEWKWLNTAEFETAAAKEQCWNVALGADLDFGGLYNYQPFQMHHVGSVLYGKGHKIMNVNVTEVYCMGTKAVTAQDGTVTTYGSDPCMAVICSNETDGDAFTIQNLTFENITIQAPQALDASVHRPGSGDHYIEAAPLCGLNNVTLQNVDANHISVYAPMPGSEVDNEDYAWVLGGLASKALQCTITNCNVSDIVLRGYRYCGGLLGYTKDTYSTVTGCTASDVVIRTTRQVLKNQLKEYYKDGTRHLWLELGALNPFIACRNSSRPFPDGHGNTVSNFRIFHPNGTPNMLILKPGTGEEDPDYPYYTPANPFWGLALDDVPADCVSGATINQ